MSTFQRTFLDQEKDSCLFWGRKANFECQDLHVFVDNVSFCIMRTQLVYHDDSKVPCNGLQIVQPL